VGVEAEPAEDSYKQLRDALVATHQTSAYQMTDNLFNMEPRIGRKQTEQLVAISKLRPADNKQLFGYLFLQRIPHKVGILLAKEGVRDMQALDEKTDDIVAYDRHQDHDVTGVETTAYTVADYSAVAVTARSLVAGATSRGDNVAACHLWVGRHSPLY
jgi:hypothetical protein